MNIWATDRSVASLGLGYSTERISDLIHVDGINNINIHIFPCLIIPKISILYILNAKDKGQRLFIV